jgi:phosphatidylcholine synthase
VHLFTACGAGLALLALIAAARADWPQMFWWLGVALIVDGIDGALARRLRAAEYAPRWSGEVLDFVVDYATYVLVPAFAITASGLLPAAAALSLGLAIAISGALYCADRRMKTQDNYFRGFPVLWNLVAFYLFLLQPDSWVAAVLVVALVVLTFIPLPFVHPFRVRRLRALSLLLVAIWSILAAIALAGAFATDRWLKWALCAIAGYFLFVGLATRPGRANGAAAHD